MGMVTKRLNAFFETQVSIAPLILFRMVWGSLLFISTLRFIVKGWVHTMYIQPKIFFPFYGFEWVKPLGSVGMYLVFALLLLTSLCILLGYFYRYASLLFFLLFTYVELIDKTNYLNHYYFVSLVSFIFLFLPANKNFSLDVRYRGVTELAQVPRFYEWLIKAQLFTVYLFAGIAKVNTDWLLDAQPLKIWLPAFSHWPLIGQYMESDWVAYLFSWFGCLYDLCIGFLLFYSRTTKWAYLIVLVFHLFTALFFNIGMFPYIMIGATLIFMPLSFHQKGLQYLASIFKISTPLAAKPLSVVPSKHWVIFILFFGVQLVLPFRYLLYPGKLFWTEQGYRFSWRVMLMEKAGTAFFFVKDSRTGKSIEIDNKNYLTYMQEKQMAMQPDMLLNYAHFLKKEFEKKGFVNPKVSTQCYVTLNGRPSRLLVNDTVDLSVQSNSFLKNKWWILPY